MTRRASGSYSGLASSRETRRPASVRRSTRTPARDSRSTSRITEPRSVRSITARSSIDASRRGPSSSRASSSPWSRDLKIGSRGGAGARASRWNAASSERPCGRPNCAAEPTPFDRMFES
ncbi:hypothetical protein [Actinomadura napierensis]|uniref:hypothetical protein n=1 Tax=Actinomadura napierensis TaxID=267854 RepID=UPI0031E41512